MENTFLSKVEQIKEDYYDKNGKNIIFKKSQKNECAKEISNHIDVDLLIKNTMYIIPNSNKIFFNYEMFKLYANEDNYEKIYKYLLSLFQSCIDCYTNYEVHLSIKTFTVSACERYKKFVILLTQQCLQERKNYSYLLTKFYIYYTPNCISNIIQITTPFIDPVVRHKVVLYSKNESYQLLQNLLTPF
jgi:hypothetical protein